MAAPKLETIGRMLIPMMYTAGCVDMKEQNEHVESPVAYFL